MFYDVVISDPDENRTLLNGECVDGEQRAWTQKAIQLATKHQKELFIEFKPRTARFRIKPATAAKSNGSH